MQCSPAHLCAASSPVQRIVVASPGIDPCSTVFSATLPRRSAPRLPPPPRYDDEPIVESPRDTATDEDEIDDVDEHKNGDDDSANKGGGSDIVHIQQR